MENEPDPVLKGQTMRSYRTSDGYVIRYITTGRMRKGRIEVTPVKEIIVDPNDKTIQPKNTLLKQTCDGTTKHSFFADGEGGHTEQIELESVNCGFTPLNPSEQRQKLITHLSVLSDIISGTNVLSKKEVEQIQEVIKMTTKFVQLTPIVLKVNKKYQVYFYYRNRPLTWLETIKYKMFGSIPVYKPSDVTNHIYAGVIDEIKT